MKINLTAVIMLVFCPIIFGQNAKIKDKNIGYKYAIYSEVSGYDKYTMFNIKISDKKGTVYTYSEGNTTQAQNSDINNMSGMAYPLRQNTLKNDLFFEVVQNSSSPLKKVAKSFEDQTTKAVRHYYEITADQNYTVRIIDVKNGNKLIKEITVAYTPTAIWPLTGGYNSAQLLADNYKNQQETVPGFFRKIDAKLIENALVKRIGKDIAMVMHDTDVKEFFFASYVSTKDPTFNRLDSAAIYLELAMDAISANAKADIKGNHHVANVQSNIKKAHAIYVEFSKPEYLNWFVNGEVKEEYEYCMKANLYFTSFLISDFAKANELFNQLKMKIEAEKAEAAKAADVGGVAGVGQLLKRTNAMKAYDNINQFRIYQVREERLFNEFKTRFGY